MNSKGETWRRAVVKVGNGRGFVVNRRCYLGYRERIIITAAHCLPSLPPCHPGRHLHEERYESLLSPLEAEPTVWAACLFADPIADIAVLGPPDNQELSDKADAYEQLVMNAEPLETADAPAQGSQILTLRNVQLEHRAPGEGPALVLSLDGHWLQGQVARRAGWLAFEPKELFVVGMSGSPILSPAGEAIGVVSVDALSPVLVDSLSARLLREISDAPRYQAGAATCS
jgi:hypothetical protein